MRNAASSHLCRKTFLVHHRFCKKSKGKNSFIQHRRKYKSKQPETIRVFQLSANRISKVSLVEMYQKMHLLHSCRGLKHCRIVVEKLNQGKAIVPVRRLALFCCLKDWLFTIYEYYGTALE